jgi:hypothetical protein
VVLDCLAARWTLLGLDKEPPPRDPIVPVDLGESPRFLIEWAQRTLAQEGLAEANAAPATGVRSDTPGAEFHDAAAAGDAASPAGHPQAAGDCNDATASDGRAAAGAESNNAADRPNASEIETSHAPENGEAPAPARRPQERTENHDAVPHGRRVTADERSSEMYTVIL